MQIMKIEDILSRFSKFGKNNILKNKQVLSILVNFGVLEDVEL